MDGIDQFDLDGIERRRQLYRGGQGRTADEVEDAGYTLLCWIVWGVYGTLCVAAGYLVGRIS